MTDISWRACRWRSAYCAPGAAPRAAASTTAGPWAGPPGRVGGWAGRKKSRPLSAGFLQGAVWLSSGHRRSHRCHSPRRSVCWSGSPGRRRRLRHFGVDPFDKTEAFGSTGFAVHHDLGGGDTAKFGEVAFQAGIGHGVGQVAHVDLGAHRGAFLKNAGAPARARRGEAVVRIRSPRQSGGGFRMRSGLAVLCQHAGGCAMLVCSQPWVTAKSRAASREAKALSKRNTRL